MKAVFVAAAAAVLAGGVSAGHVHHRHVHDLLKAEKRGNDQGEVCVPGCTTIWTTITGPPTLYTPPPAPSTSSFVNTTSFAKPTTTPCSSSVPPTTSSAPLTVPTPITQTCPTPGTYTFPATTVVVSETTTVCGASTTTVPSGTHTLGGVTTVVEKETTVVCPYATTKTQGTTVTSVIETTTYVCPSAGTYTIAPITTTVTASTTVIPVPVITTYCPGTYTAPAVVTTVTETDVVVYCPFASPSLSTAPPEVTTTHAEASKTSAPSASSSAPKATETSGLGSGGSQWAMTYTPYTSTGQCKDAQTVMQDLAQIKKAGFTTVRVYSTDCNTLSNVGAGCEAAGLKMILGIYVGEVGCDNSDPDVAEQISEIKNWAKWDLVELVVVGNEVLFNGYCTVSQLTSLIEETKSALTGAGYTGPFSTTDVVSSYQDNDVTSVCNAIDVVCTNAYAYFNDATLPSEAGPFVESQLKIVEGVCGKTGYVMETGWPSEGVCNGVACAGSSEQEAAIKSIKDTLGNKVVFFSFSNDEWKEPGECQCEQHWGCGQLFGA